MSIINDIEIRNFKSIRHQKIEGCKRINVFVGPPNVGKSNILEAIGMFTIPYLNFLNSRNTVLKQLVRYNSFVDIFNDEKEFGFVEYRNSKNEFHSVSLKMTNFSNENEINKLHSRAKDLMIMFESDPNFGFFYLDNGDNYLKSAQKSTLVSKIKSVHEPILYYKFKSMDYFIDDIFDYLNPPFGYNIGRIIDQNTDLRKFVSDELIKVDLKLNISQPDFKPMALKFKKDDSSYSFPFNLLADTFQRILFYKAAISSNQNSVLLFEEPEAQCYEPYILEITNDIKRDKSKNQYFIVTHSDFIIQEFLRDEESKNDTNIYLVNSENGKTVIKLLSRESNEDVYEYGLNSFFNFENLWETN
jgi:AAA15 family ATPase/GTPase